MNITVPTTIVYETIECAVCGHLMALPTTFVRNRRDDHKGFYCPNGHSNYFAAQSEADRLREEKARAISQLDQERAARYDAEHGRAKVERKLARVAKGVCPECQRTFRNLARHMKCKHVKARA